MCGFSKIYIRFRPKEGIIQNVATFLSQELLRTLTWLVTRGEKIKNRWLLLNYSFGCFMRSKQMACTDLWIFNLFFWLEGEVLSSEEWLELFVIVQGSETNPSKDNKQTKKKKKKKEFTWENPGSKANLVIVRWALWVAQFEGQWLSEFVKMVANLKY